MAGADRMPGKSRRLPSPSLLQLPALQAIVLQCVAALVVLGAAQLFPALPLGLAAGLQGLIAAALSVWRGLPVWWWMMQLGFPVIVLVALAAALPSWIFLSAFLLMAAIFWSTWRTRVPLFLSGPLAWREVERLLPEGQVVRVLDVGSGLGGLVLHLGRRRPQAQLAGIEIAPLPWLISRLRAGLAGSAARFLRGDYHALDFADYDLVFAYLSPAAMPALWEKAAREMRPGSLLLSYEFVIPDLPPDIERQCGQRVLRGWRIGRQAPAH